MKEKKYFITLQSCKGIAALFIAIGHYLSWKGDFTTSYILMCDFFFMCSGVTSFLSMSYYHETNDANESYLKHLIKNKLKKIYIPYVIVWAVWIIINTLFIHANNTLYTSFISLLLLQCMGFTSNGEELLNTSPIGIAWYISIDVWIGSIFSFVAYRLKNRKGLLCIISAVIALISWNIIATSSPNFMDIHYAKIMFENITLTYGIFRGLLGYSLGFILANIYCEINERNLIINSNIAVCTVIEAVMVISFMLLYGTTQYIRQNELLFPIWSFIFILIMLHENGLLSRFLKTRFFILLSKYSYYIYLVHMIALVFLNWLLNYETNVYIYILIIVLLSLILERMHKLTIFVIKKLYR